MQEQGTVNYLQKQIEWRQRAGEDGQWIRKAKAQLESATRFLKASEESLEKHKGEKRFFENVKDKHEMTAKREQRGTKTLAMVYDTDTLGGEMEQIWDFGSLLEVKRLEMCLKKGFECEFCEERLGGEEEETWQTIKRFKTHKCRPAEFNCCQCGWPVKTFTDIYHQCTIVEVWTIE